MNETIKLMDYNTIQTKGTEVLLQEPGPVGKFAVFGRFRGIKKEKNSKNVRN